MNISALFVAFLALSARQNELTTDLIEFLDLVSQDDILAITDEFLQIQEFRDVVNYILNENEIRELMLRGEAIPKYRKLLAYLDESGAEVYDYINAIHEVLELPPFVPNAEPRNAPQTDGPAPRTAPRAAANILNEFRDRIRALLDKNAINALHQKKLTTSAAFKFFSDRVNAQEHADLLADLVATSEYKSINAILLENGVDLVDAVLFYSQIFGFKPL